MKGELYGVFRITHRYCSLGSLKGECIAEYIVGFMGEYFRGD